MNTQFEKLVDACRIGDLELAQASIFDDLNVHAKNDKLVKVVCVEKHFHILKWLLEMADQMGDPYDVNAVCDEVMGFFGDDETLNNFINCINDFNNRNNVEPTPEPTPEPEPNPDVILDDTNQTIDNNIRIIDEILNEITEKYNQEEKQHEDDIARQQQAWEAFTTDLSKTNEKVTMKYNELLGRPNDSDIVDAWQYNPLHIKPFNYKLNDDEDYIPGSAPIVQPFTMNLRPRQMQTTPYDSETDKDMPELEPATFQNNYESEDEDPYADMPPLEPVDDMPQYLSTDEIKNVLDIAKKTLQENIISGEMLEFTTNIIDKIFEEIVNESKTRQFTSSDIIDLTLERLPQFVLNQAESGPKNMVQLETDEDEDDSEDEEFYELVMADFSMFMRDNLVPTSDHNIKVSFDALHEAFSLWCGDDIDDWTLSPSQFDGVLGRMFCNSHYDGAFLYNYNFVDEVNTNDYGLIPAQDLRRDAIKSIVNDIKNKINDIKDEGILKWYLGNGQIKYYHELADIFLRSGYKIQLNKPNKIDRIIIEW